jgi:RNA polymerase sporulation-specific sigma factor
MKPFQQELTANEILMHYRNNKKNSKNVSLDESIGFDKEGNEITILDILKTPTPDFALDLHKENNIKDLKKYLDVLTEREKEIIIYRYGLYDNDEITQKELAKKLNISRSYVSRIEKRALTKILREFLKYNKDI